MSKASASHIYSNAEERLNIVSHAVGLTLSVAGVLFLLLKAANHGTLIHTVSFAVFGASLVVLYLASTLYHSARHTITRSRLRTFDHAAIYILIAGTYTPFVLIVLKGTIGWILFGVTWGMASVGIVLKLFFTGRYDHLSTAMYVLMGWIIVLAIKPLVANFHGGGLAWLFAGGIAYTLGAAFYSVKRMPYGHATFHGFVLLGSICHFVAVYAYILIPANA